MKKKNIVYFLALAVMACVVFKFDTKSYALYQNYAVSDERELKIAVSVADYTDSIVLTQDVCINQDIKIEASVTLDLNGYNIYILNDNVSIVIGKKVFSHTESYTEVVPGYYTHETKYKVKTNPGMVIKDDDGNKIRISQNATDEVVKEWVWHPEQEKVKYRDVYEYGDGIDVIIKNGTIVGKDGKDGQDGKENTWSYYNGQDGKTPKEPIEMISGTLRLYNMFVYAGNGGDGGDGSYQKLFHIPFGGGSGGNGGNGAKGGNVVKVTRDECKVCIDDYTFLVPGEGGSGGSKSNANPNYWLYRGWNGDQGKDGKDGLQISK